MDCIYLYILCCVWNENQRKKNCFLYKTPKPIFVIIQIVLCHMISQKEVIVFKLLPLILKYSANVFGSFMSFFCIAMVGRKIELEE